MGERRKDRKNPIGFTPRQLGVILDFCRELPNDSRISYSKFHRKNGTYSRKQSTTKVLMDAYRRMVLTGPFLFCNHKINANLIKTDQPSSAIFEEKKRDPLTTLAIELDGAWKLVWFYKGESSLQYTNTTIPNYLSQRDIKQIYPEEIGAFETDAAPQGWDALDWEIFNLMRFPRKYSYVEVGRRLDTPWKTVSNRFKKISQQCRSLACFFPLGFEGYQPIFLTFKTKFEIGIEKTLRKLNRSTYIYKFNDVIALMLFVAPEPWGYNNAVGHFKELEEMGIIHDLRVSIPINWHSIFSSGY